MRVMRFALVPLLFGATLTLPAQSACLSCSPLVTAPTAAAAESDPWTWTVAPYLLFPTMQGKTGLGNLPSIDVNAGAGEIFSHLQFGAMMFVQARKGPWAFVLDGIYMDLKQDLTPNATWASGSVKMSQGALEGLAFRRVGKPFEVMLGALGNHIQASATVTLTGLGQTAQRVEGTAEVWGAPVAGFRWTPISDPKWRAVLFADIGGLGSDNWTWQALPSVSYRFSGLFELALQYRWMGISYQTGSGADTFLYDMTIFGPEVAFAFHF